MVRLCHMVGTLATAPTLQARGILHEPKPLARGCLGDLIVAELQRADRPLSIREVARRLTEAGHHFTKKNVYRRMFRLREQRKVVSRPRGHSHHALTWLAQVVTR